MNPKLNLLKNKILQETGKLRSTMKRSSSSIQKTSRSQKSESLVTYIKELSNWVDSCFFKDFSEKVESCPNTPKSDKELQEALELLKTAILNASHTSKTKVSIQADQTLKTQQDLNCLKEELQNLKQETLTKHETTFYENLKTCQTQLETSRQEAQQLKQEVDSLKQEMHKLKECLNFAIQEAVKTGYKQTKDTLNLQNAVLEAKNIIVSVSREKKNSVNLHESLVQECEALKTQKSELIHKYAERVQKLLEENKVLKSLINETMRKETWVCESKINNS